MRHHPSAAAAVASLLACAILGGACLQSPEASPTSTEQAIDRGSEPEQVDQASPPAEPIGEAPEANVYVGAPYGAQDFKFKIEKKWDGKDKAGGRQRALEALPFVIRDGQTGEDRDSWECRIDVSMAVQGEKVGYISPARAALATANVVNKAAPAVSHSRADWTGQSALFCIELKVTMNNFFRADYESYGARVIQWLP